MVSPELRYGHPPADQILYNRVSTVGYSYALKQPKWSIQVLSRTNSLGKSFPRLDNFREDHRIPEMFRATLEDFRGSGKDRGHLINSYDSMGSLLANSESFLLSNISPQLPDFNRDIWLASENGVRNLFSSPKIQEVYVISGPAFSPGKVIETIGDGVAVPHYFFKSVLAERAQPRSKRQLLMWSFLIPNKGTDRKLSDFVVPTKAVEKMAGLPLWGGISGEWIDYLKSQSPVMI